MTPTLTEAAKLARAHIVWLAFGECRSPGWDGAPPSAKEAVDAPDAALSATEASIQADTRRWPLSEKEVDKLVYANREADGTTMDFVRLIERAHGVTTPPAQAEPSAQEPVEVPHIELGHGNVEVAEGTYAGLHALIFGRHGTGVIGEATTPDREHQPGETLAAVTFTRAESIAILIDKLEVIRKKMAPAATPQPQPPSPEQAQAKQDVQAVPEGFALVPKELDGDRLHDAWRAAAGKLDHAALRHVHATMIASPAPGAAPPVQGPLTELAQRLRQGGWDLRSPQEMADLIADKIEAAIRNQGADK